MSTAALRGALTTRGSDRALLRRLYLARPQQMVKALGLDLLTATERLALVDDLSALAAGRSVPGVEGGDIAASRARDGLRALVLFGRCGDDVVGALPWAVVGGLRHLRVKVGAAPTELLRLPGLDPLGGFRPCRVRQRRA